jgi:predicted adenine nucleotide alpha hydrolase (AANH) superfamily ATPase
MDAKDATAGSYSPAAPTCDRDLLLHVCCGPCWCAVRGSFQPGRRVVGWFDNPNVHGLIEFRRRLKAARSVAEQTGAALRFDDRYRLKAFLETCGPEAPARCDACYRMRLASTAARAAIEGFAAFSTTLLVSRHQRHERIAEIGQEVGREHGVAFEYHDWRPLQAAGQAEAARRRLYRQSYCGCIFSEADRYEGTALHCFRSGRRLV